MYETLLSPDRPKMMPKFPVSHFMFVGKPIVVLNIKNRYTAFCKFQ